MILKAAQWSFLLLIASLPFVRPFNFFVSGLRVPYTDIIFLIAAGLAAAAVVTRQLQFRFDRAFYFLGAYAGILTITAFFPEASFIKLLGEYYLFALCFLTFLHCHDREFARRIVVTWVAVTVATGAFSVLGFVLFYSGLTAESNNYFLSHLGSLPAGNYPRVQGLFANPNMLCNYLNISIPFIWLAGRSGWITGWAFRAALGLALVAALFSLSPGLGGVALSMGLLAYIARERKGYSRLLSFASGILAATAFFAVTLISSDTPNTQQEVPFSNGTMEPSVRVLVWENVIQRVSVSPILGRGIGSHPAQKEYIPLTGERQFLTDAHNMYLNVLGQSGAIGLAVFILLLVHLLRRGQWAPDDAVDLLIPVLASAFVGTVLYQGLTGSFEEARHIWVLVGMLIAASSAASAKVGISPASIAL